MRESLSDNLGMDLLRVTEAAAVAAGRWMGRGQTLEADQAAAEAMYRSLNTVDIDGTIVLGEETRLGTHSVLDSGQKVGTGNGPELDVVIDPIDGVNLLANSRPGAIAVATMATRGAMRDFYPAKYMEKIVVDPDTAKFLVPECINAPAGWTLALVAQAKKKSVQDLVVFVLDRPRHKDLIEEIRTAGAQVLMRLDGDVAGALMAASTRILDVDVMMGIGGAAEGVVAAGAVKSLHGGMLARLAPQTEEEKRAILEAGLDLQQILTCEELVRGNKIFFAATGITGGGMLQGVQYRGDFARTESIVLRYETYSKRVIQAEHYIGR